VKPRCGSIDLINELSQYVNFTFMQNYLQL